LFGRILNERILNAINRFFKDTIIYGIAAVLPRAVNIVLVKLHTNTLASEKYAENTIYFVYAAYFNALLTYGMETAFFRFFTKEKEKGKVVSTSFISLLTTTLLFFGLMYSYSDELTYYFGFSDPLYLKILIAVTTLDTLVVLPYAYLRVTNRPIRFMFFKVLNILIYAFFNLYFLWYVPYALGQGAYVPEFIASGFSEHPLVLYIFVANLLASAATFLLLLPTLLKFQMTFDRKLLGRMLMYGLPIMISSIAYVTNENLDKLLLEHYFGKEEMGIYAACYKLGVFMTLYILAFKLGAEPFFFNQADKKNAKDTYARIMTWFLIFGALFMLIVVGFIDLFAGLLLGKEEYFAALMIVPVILLANLFLGIYYNLSIWFKLTDKTRYGMYFSLAGAMITLALNLALIPVLGIMASAWATLAAYLTMVLLSYFYSRKYYPIPYTLKKSGLLLVLATGLSYLSFVFFRGNYLVSAVLTILFIGYAYWNQKNEIREIWKA
jgi:O-antigen/teichoic acid export membrane protein